MGKKQNGNSLCINKYTVTRKICSSTPDIHQHAEVQMSGILVGLNYTRCNRIVWEWCGQSRLGGGRRPSHPRDRITWWQVQPVNTGQHSLPSTRPPTREWSLCGCTCATSRASLSWPLDIKKSTNFFTSPMAMQYGMTSSLSSWINWSALLIK